MSKVVTNAQILAAITALGARVDALEAPVAAAPVAAAKVERASAKFGNRTFTEYVAARNAAKVACELHAPEDCNRTFSPASSGREGHEARIVTPKA